MSWVWCSYIYSQFHKKGYCSLYYKKKIAFWLKKGCFIGSQNKRFRLKKGCFFFVQNTRKGVVFQTWYERGIPFGRVGVGWGCWRGPKLTSHFQKQWWSSSFVQIVAWRRAGDKPLSEPMMAQYTDWFMKWLGVEQATSHYLNQWW